VQNLTVSPVVVREIANLNKF